MGKKHNILACMMKGMSEKGTKIDNFGWFFKRDLDEIKIYVGCHSFSSNRCSKLVLNYNFGHIVDSKRCKTNKND